MFSEVSGKPRGAEWLWHPQVVALYKAVLQNNTSSSVTREAALGALQNITIGESRVRKPSLTPYASSRVRGLMTSPRSGRVTSPRCGHMTAPQCDHVTAPRCDHMTAPRCGHVTAPRCDHVTAPRSGHMTALRCGHMTAPRCGHILLVLFIHGAQPNILSPRR